MTKIGIKLELQDILNETHDTLLSSDFFKTSKDIHELISTIIRDVPDRQIKTIERQRQEIIGLKKNQNQITEKQVQITQEYIQKLNQKTQENKKLKK